MNHDRWLKGSCFKKKKIDQFVTFNFHTVLNIIRK